MFVFSLLPRCHGLQLPIQETIFGAGAGGQGQTAISPELPIGAETMRRLNQSDPSHTLTPPQRHLEGSLPANNHLLGVRPTPSFRELNRDRKQQPITSLPASARLAEKSFRA